MEINFFFFLKKGWDIYLEVIWITGAKEMSWNQCKPHGRVHFLLLESTSPPRLSSALTIQKMTIAFARVSASPQGKGFPAELVVPYSSQHVPFCILMNLLTQHLRLCLTSWALWALVHTHSWLAQPRPKVNTERWTVLLLDLQILSWSHPSGASLWLAPTLPSQGRFSSVAQSCPILCNPMDCSTPSLPVHHQLLELAQTISIESMMPSNLLILCHPLLLLPSIFPSIRGFSNESALCIRWPEYWSFNFSISPSNEHPGLISFRMDWLDVLAVQGTLKSLLQYHSSKASILWCSAFFIVKLSHPYMTTGKTIALTRWTFVGKGQNPRMGTTCIPVVDSFWYLAKLIQLCKV